MMVVLDGEEVSVGSQGAGGRTHNTKIILEQDIT